MQELGDLGGVAVHEPLPRQVLDAVLGVQVEEVEPDAVLPLPQDVIVIGVALQWEVGFGGHRGRHYPGG